MVGFSREDAKKVAEATRYVLGTPKTKVRRNAPYRSNATGFWAKITDCPDPRDTGDCQGRYSWVAVEWDADHEIVEKEEWGEGKYDGQFNYAIERNFSKWVPVETGDVVWLEGQCGEQPYLVFDYEGITKYGAATTTITARSGAFVGNGSWQVYGFSTDDLLFSYQTIDVVKVYNPWDTEIDSGTKIECQFCQGVWMLTGAEC